MMTGLSLDGSALMGRAFADLVSFWGICRPKQGKTCGPVFVSYLWVRYKAFAILMHISNFNR